MRWQTYNIMAAFTGSKALAEAGIHNPSDLLPLPWDKNPAPSISDEEQAELQAEMAAINANIQSTENG